LPRWALGCYWRRDGVPIWRNPELCAADGKDYGHTQKQAGIFIQALVKHLGVNPDCIIPVDEPETQELAGYTLPPGMIHSRSKNSLSMSWARNRSALVSES